jgi:hypothetical protein
LPCAVAALTDSKSAAAKVAFAANTRPASRILEHHHETSIHVILLMAVEQRIAWIVGRKVNLNGFSGVDKNNVLSKTSDCGPVFKPPDLECMPMQVHGMVIHTLIPQH